MAQITGERSFWGRSFRVTADTLDPRPETETLIEAALADGPAAQILDLGTGTGCLLVTLLAEWPSARGVGVDISASALAVAAANAGRHGVADRAAFIEGDWFTGIEGRFDVVVANPPYVAEAERSALAPEVRDHEPPHALTPIDDPGGDGLGAYRRIAPDLAERLSQGGRAYLEIGATQGAAATAIFADAGFDDLAILTDLDGRDRVLCVNCVKNSAR